MKRPLVIVSGLNEREAAEVLPVLERLRRPLCIEATSRLRGHEHLVEFELQGRDWSIPHLDFDGVIRVGNVPTLRYWRDLETSDLPVWNFSNIPFSGMPREQVVRRLNELPDMKFEEWDSEERARDRELGDKRTALFQKFPLSEPAWINRLSLQIPSSARVFLGNSLPIREWDFAAHSGAARDIFANRGTNGIDGLISTFAGCAREMGPNWAIIGDLSAMYDLSGPWALRQRPVDEFNLVIINNAGGQIFHRMFRNPMFINKHNVGFSDWAAMWDLEYVALEKPKPLRGGRQVVEILPNAKQTEEFWLAWEKK
jgi:2-succinyl-5-enolpyruvyl-6-hydroxy-3-cyclohexene-1-carboxylate synthase